jgi:uncharacterized protein (TIGR01777 family)
MKVVIPGGSGHLGTLLARDLQGDGHDVVVLSRGAAAAPWRTRPWDARTVGDWAAEIDGADVVINLAGRSINCRHTPENARVLLSSRVDSTRAVGEAIARAARPPRLWLQASSAAIYAERPDAANDEATGALGGDEPDLPPKWRLGARIAKDWERALADAPTPATRKVALRISIVMAPERGSAFDILLRLVRLGLGGRQGDGRQYVSWIHHADFVRAVRWLIEREDLRGPVNMAAPHPLPNADFMRALREAWGIRVGLPAAAWMIVAGSLLIRTEPELVLKSRRVVPGRLLEHGFEFRFPDWPQAARDLCAARA